MLLVWRSWALAIFLPLLQEAGITEVQYHVPHIVVPSLYCIFLLCVGEHACRGACVEVRGQFKGSALSFPLVLEAELR